MQNVEVNLDAVLVRNVNTKIREESFGGIVVSRDNPTMCLNESAVFLFDLCDGKRSVKDVVVSTAKKLGVEPDRVASKILTALTWMRHVGILKSKDDISKTAPC
ncbi:MAG: PqqD family protein [Alphaproteobacteria bacterium]|nr:PqqD family protein [Alphaproteobacteria bacterium]